MSYSFPPEPSKRRDAGVFQITERDISTLTWITEQYCVSFDHLQHLLGRYPKATTKRPNQLSISATRHAVERWLHLDLIESPRKVLRGHTSYVWLSRKGLTQLGLPYAYYKPKPATIQHIYAVNAVRFYIEQSYFPIVWYSNRLLVRTSNARPLPDAEIHTGTATVAVQVMERIQPLALQEEINTLCTLASRENGTTPYYAYFWYFLSAESVSPFQKELSTLDTALQQRVRVYPIDTQREKTRPQVEERIQQPTQESAM